MTAQELENQINERLIEMGKIDARKEAIKSKNPEIREHIEKTWVPT